MVTFFFLKFLSCSTDLFRKSLSPTENTSSKSNISGSEKTAVENANLETIPVEPTSGKYQGNIKNINLRCLICFQDNLIITNLNSVNPQVHPVNILSQKKLG